MVFTLMEIAEQEKTTVAAVNYWTQNGLKFSWQLDKGQPRKVVDQRDLAAFLVGWKRRKRV